MVSVGSGTKADSAVPVVGVMQDRQQKQFRCAADSHVSGKPVWGTNISSWRMEAASSGALADRNRRLALFSQASMLRLTVTCLLAALPACLPACLLLLPCCCSISGRGVTNCLQHS
jgi:hypothetical protein